MNITSSLAENIGGKSIHYQYVSSVYIMRWRVFVIVKSDFHEKKKNWDAAMKQREKEK